MQYQGNRNLSAYMTAPQVKPANTLTSAVGGLLNGWKAYDTYPAPAPLRRSLTTSPWSPSVYYSTVKVNSSIPSASRQPSPLAHTNQMSQVDNIQTPGLFSAARNSLYTRYTPADWNRHKHNISADQVRANSERIRTDSRLLASELDDKTKRTTADVGNKIGNRIADISFWKTQLSHETEAIIKETEQLEKAKRAVEIFLKESDNQIHIARECLYQREKRQGIDLVHDDPEEAMIGEIDLTRHFQKMVRNQLELTDAQLSLNRAAQHELEVDNKDKHIAANIDTIASKLKETSRGIAMHRGVEYIDNTVTVPESWAEYTNNNIVRSEVERAASKKLRSNIQSMLNYCGEELWKQWNKVNTALSRRVQETIEAKNKIQAHLSGTLQEVFDTERSVSLLKKGIEDKINPLKAASTRLSNRLYRPNMEACKDAAQHRLLHQVYELYESIESLTSQLRSTEDQLQALHRKRSDLEQDLAIKNNTLFIDSDKCMGMRRTYPMQSRIWQLI